MSFKIYKFLDASIMALPTSWENDGKVYPKFSFCYNSEIKIFLGSIWSKCQKIYFKRKRTTKKLEDA